MNPLRPLLLASALLLAALTPAAEEQASPPPQLPPGWDNITAKLWDQIPGYEDNQWWYNRRVGTVHVDNTNGDLYVMLCQHWGTYRSTDCGETWTLADNTTAHGRHVEDRGVAPNPQTGDFVLFKVHGGQTISKEKVLPQSAIVLDHGTTWLPVPNLGEGFRCGMADWRTNPPTTLLARRHHYDGPSLFLTTDRGATWQELPHHGGHCLAMLTPDTILLAFDKDYPENIIDGKEVDSRAFRWWLKFQPKDIMLTTDRCETFTKVAEFAPRSETPTAWGEHLYWIAAEGVMVSRDRGRTWSVLGQPIPDLLYGPYFGQNEDTLVVVTKDGFYKTENAGEKWTRIADLMLPQDFQPSAARPAWDPVHNVIYLGFIGDDVYRHRLAAPATQ